MIVWFQSLLPHAPKLQLQRHVLIRSTVNGIFQAFRSYVFGHLYAVFPPILLTEIRYPTLELLSNKKPMTVGIGPSVLRDDGTHAQEGLFSFICSVYIAKR